MDPRTVKRPPRLADAILRRALPRGTTGLAILGDLREEFRARVARDGGAGWWYWREAMLLSLRYATSRVGTVRPRRRAWMLSNDIRTACRALVRNAATSAIIVLTLGAAIAASTIGFTFADLAILRGLPVSDPERVVAVYGVDPRQSDGRARLSLANYRDLEARATTLEHFAAFHGARATLVDGGIPISLDVTRVSPEFFAAMGVGASAGRVFRPGDDQPGRLAVVLAHHYWERVHGANLAVLGSTLFVNGRSHIVVGVASPELEFGNLATTNLWLPLEISPTPSRTERTVTTMARLGPGVSIEAARAELSAVAGGLALEYPEENRDWRVHVAPIGEIAYGRGFWVIITLFIAAVVLIMVIACANAASLVLARALARRREIALRAALGAGRWRLLRQSLVEGMILSALAAALALPLAESALRVIRAFDSEPAIQQLALDTHEIGFVTILALITPILFSLLPTLAAVRLDLRAALQSGGMRAAGGAGRGRTALVALQLALAVALLTTAGLAVRTGINLSSIDYGIRTDAALTFALQLEDAAWRSDPHRLLDAVRARLGQVPGIESVHAFRSFPVLGAEPLVSIEIEGRPVAAGDVRPWAIANSADAGALAALGVPLVTGRWLSAEEERRQAPVALVGETAARLYFGSSEAALGRRLAIAAAQPAALLEIVGVVGDVLANDVERGTVPRVWTPLGDSPRLTFVVPARAARADLAAAVRREMAAVAPATPVEQLESMERAFARFRASNQVVIGIFAGFAVLALLLAMIGLYGLVTYTVAQRIPEFATRFALGARPHDVVRLVVGQVGRLTGIGVTVGLLTGLAAGQGMRGVLYGVSATDPITIAGVTGLIATVALGASVRPALRAARTSLTDALRAE